MARKSGTIPGTKGKRIPGNPPRLNGSAMTKTRVPNMPGPGAQSRVRVRDARGRFSGGWGLSITGLEAASDALYERLDDRLQTVKDAAEDLASEMLSYAKANAPWDDRSGTARRELWSSVVWTSETTFSIMLGHGAEVFYGIYLEVKWGGRYGIILPTLMQYAPRLNAHIRSRT